MNCHGIDSSIQTFIPIQIYISLEISLNYRIILVNSYIFVYLQIYKLKETVSMRHPKV